MASVFLRHNSQTGYFKVLNRNKKTDACKFCFTMLSPDSGHETGHLSQRFSESEMVHVALLSEEYRGA